MKTAIVLVLAVVSQTAGNLLVSRGMKQAAFTGSLGLTNCFPFLLQAAANPSTWLGTLLLIIFFALYAALLSRADLSFVLPVSSFGYILNVALAHYLLHEPVSRSRWIGTLLTSIGVAFVSMTGKQSTWHRMTEPVPQSAVPQ